MLNTVQAVDLALLLLRLVLGLTMAAHGAQKLFGWFGGRGFSGTLGMMGMMGVRPAWLWAAAVCTGEFGGGLLVALGLLTPVGAALVIAVMVVAIATVHWPKGFFSTQGGYEFNLLIIAAAAAIGIAGPGAYALDAGLGLLPILVAPATFVVSVVVALAGAGLALATRATRKQPQPAGASR
jgi:putative oxidoreductase